MRLLVSVRSVAEAAIAADGGADFIDLKEPRGGALGGLPVATIAAIVAALAARRRDGVVLSATIGDLPMDDLPGILAQVDAVAACGVDYVKVGIEREPGAAAVLDALAAAGPAIVPVFIADRGVDVERVAQACRARFPAVMLDTADKRAGSLFDAMPMADLQRFVDRVRSNGAQAGLAGALRRPHLAALASLRPDFAGFRSAVCAGDRGGDLDPERLRDLVRAVRGAPMRDALVS